MGGMAWGEAHGTRDTPNLSLTSKMCWLETLFMCQLLALRLAAATGEWAA